MYWLIVGAFAWLFHRLFGFVRMITIMASIPVVICLAIIGCIFYFFVLPSQFWAGL